MTLDELTKLAHGHIASEPKWLRDVVELGRIEAIRTLEALARGAIADRTALARAISDLLAEGDECGWERPEVKDIVGDVCVFPPATWCSWVSPADARAMARMLLRAADEAERAALRAAAREGSK